MSKSDDVGNADIQGTESNAKTSAYDFMGNNTAVSKFREVLISEQQGGGWLEQFITPQFAMKNDDSCKPVSHPKCSSRVHGLIGRYESEVYQCQKSYVDVLNDLSDALSEESIYTLVLSLWGDEFAKCDRNAAAILLYVAATHRYVNERHDPDEPLFWIESHVRRIRSCAMGMTQKAVVVTYVIPYMIYMYRLMRELRHCDLDSKAYLQALAINSICEICTVTGQHETCIKYAKMAICTLRYRFGDNQESCYFNMLLNLATAYNESFENEKALNAIGNALAAAGKSTCFARDAEKKTLIDRAQSFEKAIRAYEFSEQYPCCTETNMYLVCTVPIIVAWLVAALVMLYI